MPCQAGYRLRKLSRIGTVLMPTPIPIPMPVRRLPVIRRWGKMGGAADINTRANLLKADGAVERGGSGYGDGGGGCATESVASLARRTSYFRRRVGWRVT